MADYYDKFATFLPIQQRGRTAAHVFDVNELKYADIYT
jgi:hypothetical protein